MPWVSTIRNILGPSRVTWHFLVVASDSRTPAAITSRNVASNARSTATTYSFSCLCSARSTSLTMSPSLVRRISPSESLSSRPIGNTRSSWFTKSTMLPATLRSVVDVIPTGLLSAM